MNVYSDSSPALSLLGIEVHALTQDDLTAAIIQAISDRRQLVVAHHNLHSLYQCQNDDRMRAFYHRAQIAHVDGMSLVLLGRLVGLPLERRHRTTYVDWVNPLMAELAARKYRVFFLGSQPGVGETAARVLRSAHPGLQIDTAHGYFNQALGHPETEAVLARIQQYRPHVLLVGMGMPRQEYWILDHLDRLSAHAILPCGACMDYVAGVTRTPPRWMGKVGLEWLYRLFCEPGRLWKRYLVEPWVIARLLCLHWLGVGKTR